jgi:hypothetical protein
MNNSIQMVTIILVGKLVEEARQASQLLKSLFLPIRLLKYLSHSHFFVGILV